jgi:preprotein translocase subunit SecF
MIIAGLCITVAAVSLLRRDFDTAFVAAAIGMISWFLNYRIQMKELTADTQRDEHRDLKDLDEN